MKINIRGNAISDMKRINNTDKERIHNKILELEKFPNVGNLKKLTNFESAYMLRVGITEFYSMLMETTSK